MKKPLRLSKTTIGTLLVALTMLIMASAWLLEVHIGRFLCAHYGDSWLTTNGFLACYRAP